MLMSRLQRGDFSPGLKLSTSGKPSFYLIFPLAMSNSGSRNRRARQSRLRRRCPTLMKDEVTVCNALIEPSFTRCITHSREHGVLTRQYKEYAELASSLESQVLTSMSSATQSSELIRQKLVVAAQFITALSSEIKGREAHSKRFFGDSKHRFYLILSITVSML